MKSFLWFDTEKVQRRLGFFTAGDERKGFQWETFTRLGLNGFTHPFSLRFSETRGEKVLKRDFMRTKNYWVVTASKTNTQEIKDSIWKPLNHRTIALPVCNGIQQMIEKRDQTKTLMEATRTIYRKIWINLIHFAWFCSALLQTWPRLFEKRITLSTG